MPVLPRVYIFKLVERHGLALLPFRVLFISLELALPLRSIGRRQAPLQLPVRHAQAGPRESRESSHRDHARDQPAAAEEPVRDGLV